MAKTSAPATNFWESYPTGRLLAEVSLWSADFTCLGRELARMEPYADLYHFDVSDDHFVPGLLFFPDLVAALRPLTRKAFHVHLMATNPMGLIVEFAAAGANLISLHGELGPRLPAALQKIRQLGLGAGLVLGLDVPVDVVLPHLEAIDVIVMMGTFSGVKGADLSSLACPRLRAVQALLQTQGHSQRIKVAADGGIRAHTVPALRSAGADLIVMGSLAFKSQALAETFAWVHGLPK
jgi:ribulose-phosphate 3-epimerase